MAKDEEINAPVKLTDKGRDLANSLAEKTTWPRHFVIETALEWMAERPEIKALRPETETERAARELKALLEGDGKSTPLHTVKAS